MGELRGRERSTNQLGRPWSMTQIVVGDASMIRAGNELVMHHVSAGEQSRLRIVSG